MSAFEEQSEETERLIWKVSVRTQEKRDFVHYRSSVDLPTC